MKTVTKTTINDPRKLYNLTHERNYTKVSELPNGAITKVCDYAVMEDGDTLIILIIDDEGKAVVSSGKAFAEEFCGIAGLTECPFSIRVEKVKSRTNRMYAVPVWVE